MLILFNFIFFVYFNFRLATLISPKTTWTWSSPIRLLSSRFLASMKRKLWWECSTVPMRCPTGAGEKLSKTCWNHICGLKSFSFTFHWWQYKVFFPPQTFLECPILAFSVCQLAAAEQMHLIFSYKAYLTYEWLHIVNSLRGNSLSCASCHPRKLEQWEITQVLNPKMTSSIKLLWIKLV